MAPESENTLRRINRELPWVVEADYAPDGALDAEHPCCDRLKELLYLLATAKRALKGFSRWWRLDELVTTDIVGMFELELEKLEKAVSYFDGNTTPNGAKHDGSTIPTDLAEPVGRRARFIDRSFKHLADTLRLYIHENEELSNPPGMDATEAANVLADILANFEVRPHYVRQIRDGAEEAVEAIQAIMASPSPLACEDAIDGLKLFISGLRGSLGPFAARREAFRFAVTSASTDLAESKRGEEMSERLRKCSGTLVARLNLWNETRRDAHGKSDTQPI